MHDPTLKMDVQVNQYNGLEVFHLSLPQCRDWRNIEHMHMYIYIPEAKTRPMCQTIGGTRAQ